MFSRTFIESFITSNPQTVATPLVAGRNVVRMRIVVDLPAPFGPRNPTSSPGATWKSMRSTARTGPYLLHRFSTRIAWSLMGSLKESASDGSYRMGRGRERGHPLRGAGFVSFHPTPQLAQNGGWRETYFEAGHEMSGFRLPFRPADERSGAPQRRSAQTAQG